MLNFLKPVVTALLGKAVKKGAKNVAQTVTKGAKTVARGTRKGIKQVAQKTEKVGTGLQNVVRQATEVSPVLSGMIKTWGARSTADRMKALLGGAYKEGVGKAQASQFIKALKNIPFQKAKDGNQLKNIIKNMKADTVADRGVKKKILNGLGKLFSSAKSALGSGAEVAGDAATDYMVGRAVQVGGAGLVGLGSTAGGVALGAELSKK